MFKNFILLFLILITTPSITHAASAIDVPSETATNSQGHTVTPDGNDLDSVLEFITLIAEQLSCEVGGVASFLVRGEQSHTCLSPTSQIDSQIYTLLAPTWPFVALKLKMNDDRLSYLKTNGLSQCHVNNRADCGNGADCSNARLNFSFCSNTLLRLQQLIAPVDIVIDLIGGKSFVNALLDNLIRDPMTYHSGADPLVAGSISGAIGREGVYYDIASIPPMGFPWKVIRNQDTIAVATTVFGFWVPVGAKLIKEPYPISKYDQIASTGCQSIPECFADIDGKSKTFMNFSAKLIECTRQMLIRAIIDANLCNNLSGQSVGTTDNNLFHTFQLGMNRTVQALLTLYIMFFGFKILLTGGEIKKSELIMFVVKFVLVIYFSIGINANGKRYDGIMTYVIPLMLYGGNELASMVMNVSMDTYGGLCYYTASDYPAGYGHMAMWDALDCRVWHYLGLQAFFNFFNATGSDMGSAMYTPMPFYILMLAPCIYFGWIQLALILLTFPFLVIGVAIYTVQAYIICMICIILLSVFAPIFVPMALFDYTKGYFQSWYKLILSFGLQPMIVATFITLMFNLFDVTFNHTCKFYPKNTSNGKKIFLMQTDPAAYASAEDYADCTKSLGFIFTPGGLVAQATGGAALQNSPVTNGGFTKIDQYKDSFPLLAVVQKSKGLFTSGNILNPHARNEAIVDTFSTAMQMLMHMMFEMICCIIMLYVMKNMTDQLSDFAADMTEGVSVGAVTMSPNKINDLKDKANDLYKRAKSGELQKDIEKQVEEFQEGHGASGGSEGAGHGASGGSDSGGHGARGSTSSGGHGAAGGILGQGKK
jgi:type IV secretion system protein VirB6